MVNELINHIEVYQAEKIDGEWVQKLTVHYNCIGALFIPDTDSLPVPEVTVNTRRGVYVTYEPAQDAEQMSTGHLYLLVRVPPGIKNVGYPNGYPTFLVRRKGLEPPTY